MVCMNSAKRQYSANFLKNGGSNSKDVDWCINRILASLQSLGVSYT